MRLGVRFTVRLFSLAWVAFLAACTTLQPAVDSDWDARAADLLAVEEWELRGRVAVQSPAEGGQASVRWQQSGDSSRIRFSGPLGAGAYDLLWEPGYVSLTGGKGDQALEYRGDAVEQFLRDQLGWSFPAGSSRYWVMGLVNPAAAGDVRFDESGMLQGISQHGWDISYERFEVFGGHNLPTRVDLQNADTSVRMAISRWRFPQQE